ncbi:uncharacterized protein LOC133713403 [Rosa rugosa]|uniref:uncharacterized protein LOC133713403 n=1 Tax=Rosa rugosa TaxID=74645 RepID=UPI002B4157A0|nr:uncharacterized protein LOC133713403 [Rosa rugosa]
MKEESKKAQVRSMYSGLILQKRWCRGSETKCKRAWSCHFWGALLDLKECIIHGIGTMVARYGILPQMSKTASKLKSLTTHVLHFQKASFFTATVADREEESQNPKRPK